MTMTSAQFDIDVRVFIYKHFIERGAPPSIGDSARELGADSDDVTASLDRLADAHMLALKPGTHEIWMAHPLSAVPTSYRVTTARGSWWANCAWDSLGIAAMLDTSAAVAARCADCDEPQAMLVRDGSISVEAGGVVHFAVPARNWWDDIGYT